MHRLLSLSLLCIFCFATPLLSAATNHAQYGVGFGLEWDHGYAHSSLPNLGSFELSLVNRTCSIFLENGTFVDVARIEGNSQYKDIMRNLAGPEDTHSTEAFLTLRTTASKAFKSARNQLYHFLRPWQTRDPASAALGDMITALKAAAESYIGNTIAIADFATPLPPGPQGRHLLSNAMSSVRLGKAAGYPQAGPVAAMANGIGDYYHNASRCLETPNHLVVTISYTRSALTALLYFEEMCIFNILRTEHHIDLGATALDECQTSSSTEECVDPLKAAISRLVRMPVDDVDWPAHTKVPTHIGGLVLLGDRATDPRLRRALQEVLAPQDASLPVHGAGGVLGDMVDPTFAAARGIAIASWGNQNDAFMDEL